VHASTAASLSIVSNLSQYIPFGQAQATANCERFQMHGPKRASAKKCFLPPKKGRWRQQSSPTGKAATQPASNQPTSNVQPPAHQIRCQLGNIHETGGGQQQTFIGTASCWTTVDHCNLDLFIHRLIRLFVHLRDSSSLLFGRQVIILVYIGEPIEL
jgi:hypothetical protein